MWMVSSMSPTTHRSGSWTATPSWQNVSTDPYRLRELQTRAASAAGRTSGVSNEKLRALGWKPQFPDYYAALDQDPDLVPSITGTL